MHTEAGKEVISKRDVENVSLGTPPMYKCIHQPSHTSDLGSRGFGNNLIIPSPQVEIFRLLPGIEPGEGKADSHGLQAQEPTKAALGLPSNQYG